MTDPRTPPTRPTPANDGKPPGIFNLLATLLAWLGGHCRRAIAERPSPSHFFVIATGAIANLAFVTLGLHGAFGVYVPLALLIAAWLIIVQAVFFEVCRRNGLLLFLTGAGFYALIVAFNIVLAAGGITASFGADGLGQSTFRQSVSAPLAEINAITNATADFDNAMASVARHSLERQRVEVASGGTCSASPPGDGPIAELRREDATMFTAAQQTMHNLSAEGRAISTAIETEVANYTVANHHRVVTAIRNALSRAQQLARNQQMADVRRLLREREAQIATGRPSLANPSLRVFCPRDTVLGQVIRRALAIPTPGVSAQSDLPPVPSEASSVKGLFAALAAKAMRQEVDLSPWQASLLLAPLSDGMFIYGLTLHRRRRRARRTLNEGIAEDLGRPGSDPHDDFRRALLQPLVQELYASYVEQVGWFFRTDWLAIPEADLARRKMLQRLVRSGKAFDARLCKGSELPKGATGFDDDAVYHLFALKRGVWAKLEAETIRAALESDDQPDPDEPIDNHDGGEREEKAA